VPEPTDYLAIVNLQEALQGITVGAGYFYDVRGTAVKLDPNHDVTTLVEPDGPKPFIAIEVKPERREYEAGGQANSVVHITRPITVHWVRDTDPTRDADILLTFFRGVADVEKAVAADPHRGGHASETRVLTCALNSTEDGARVWAMVDLELWTIRTYGEP
jgi:hypothetical protein